MPKQKKLVAKKSFTKKQKTLKKEASGIRWGESYTSLLLGVIVVVIGFLLVFSIIKNHGYNLKSTSSITTENKEETQAKTYEIKQGDDLWKISEKIYGSGYNWVEIAKVNKITDPNIIYSGSKLQIPSVKRTEVTGNKNNLSEKNAITGNTYKIVKGDDLWNIAVKAYGDGYRWVEIANANKLTNPDLIHSDNVLIIPR
jgi:nucleoid-associated protein YgaU